MSTEAKCDTCGAVLSDPESIKRHRGTKCHIEWLEKRINQLEEQAQLHEAAIGELLKHMRFDLIPTTRG